MRKKYDTPTAEIITLTLKDVIMASEAEGVGGGGSDNSGGDGFDDDGFGF